MIASKVRPPSAKSSRLSCWVGLIASSLVLAAIGDATAMSNIFRAPPKQEPWVVTTQPVKGHRDFVLGGKYVFRLPDVHGHINASEISLDVNLDVSEIARGIVSPGTSDFPLYLMLRPAPNESSTAPSTAGGMFGGDDPSLGRAGFDIRRLPTTRAPEGLVGYREYGKSYFMILDAQRLGAAVPAHWRRPRIVRCDGVWENLPTSGRERHAQCDASHVFTNGVSLRWRFHIASLTDWRLLEKAALEYLASVDRTKK
jgi:hypothetical protein